MPSVRPFLKETAINRRDAAKHKGDKAMRWYWESEINRISGEGWAQIAICSLFANAVTLAVILKLISEAAQQ